MNRTSIAGNAWIVLTARMVIAAVLVVLALAATLDVTPARARPLGVTSGEYYSLASLFRLLGGPAWHNNTRWLRGDPCLNDWYGVTCDLTDSHVIGLTLVSNNLVGNINAVNLTGLKALETLDLSGNPITGDVGFLKLAAHPRLARFSMVANRLGGSIERLDVTGNPELEYLLLGVNFIEGYIDGLNVRANPGLKYLDLPINHIGGDIAGLDLSRNLQLEVVLLHSNLIKGDPSFIDFSHNTLLRQFTVGSNRLDGVVPDLTMTSITFPWDGGWVWLCDGANVVRPSGDALVDEFADKYDPTWSAATGCVP